MSAPTSFPPLYLLPTNLTTDYGFIEPSDGGKDVFVHISALERAGLSSLKEGQKVRIARERGKELAANLSLVE